jgi:uncharacterized protein YlaI
MKSYNEKIWSSRIEYDKAYRLFKKGEGSFNELQIASLLGRESASTPNARLSRNLSKKNYNQFAFTKRNRILKTNGFEDYQEYLKSDLWKQIKKKACFKKEFLNCHICLSEKSINLHHTKYSRNMNKPILSGLIALCTGCHDKVHKYSRLRNVSFKSAYRKLKKIFKRNIVEWECLLNKKK